jgi:hypothetical protein
MDKNKFYVRMTDKLMSGWGCADGKTSVFVVECDDYEQAQTILRAARKRSEMTRAAICIAKPRQRRGQVLSLKRSDELGSVWRAA